ncbi:MAG: YraN family protein [Acetatifactor sp.]
MNKRATGAIWEQKAAEYLEKQGMQIREKNFRNGQGEIDIIGVHEGYLVFAEVKYRRSRDMGSAVEAVDYRKQRQICKVADYYRYLHRLGENTPVRYDVIAIQGEEIHWIKNAFSHIYTRNRN